MKPSNSNLSLLFLSMILSTFACTPQTESLKSEVEKNPIIGAWEMQSVEWITSDTTYTIKKAQPGLFTFTDNSYTIMWTPIEEKRTPFVNLSEPTKEEMIAGFQSVIFNGGSYVSTDSTVTTTAKIAKVPGFEGGKQFYDFNIENNILQLTMFDETYPDGKKPEWYGKFKTRFTLKKA